MSDNIDLRRARRVRKPQGVNIDRLPPHSIECEQGVLGCILLSPAECMAECIERFRAQGQEFYDLRHLTIWDSLVELYDKGVAIEVISLQQHLKDKDMLEQVGGIAYLSALPDSVPSAANISYYLDTVVEKYFLRRSIQICTEAVGRVYDYQGKADEILDEIERDFIGIRDLRTQNADLTITELIRGNLQSIEDLNSRQGTLTGLPTGFLDLDKMTSGLQPSEMIVIAARPSVGKTSLAMNIVDTLAVDNKIPVGVFSLEMSAPSLSMRMLCSRARVNIRNVQEGFLAERDYPKIVSAAGKLANAPIYIDDAGSLTILQLRSKARRMVARWGVKCFVVDFLQLLRGTSKRSENRQTEVGEIARGIKGIAKELGLPVIVLSQLNREVEREKNRKPRLSDLRESGEIEQVADFVGFLYRAAIDDEEAVESDALPVNLYIGKQRNGPTGDVNLLFIKSYTRFESASRVSDEDVPESNPQSELGY